MTKNRMDNKQEWFLKEFVVYINSGDANGVVTPGEGGNAARVVVVCWVCSCWIDF